MMVKKKYFIAPAFIAILIAVYFIYLTNDAMLYCYDSNKYLSDEEFIRSALKLEVEQNRLPDGYKISTVDGFLSENPDCCSVERGTHPFVPASLFDRLLLGVTVRTSITVSAPSEEQRVLVVKYLMGGCGEPSERFQGFRPKIK